MGILPGSLNSDLAQIRIDTYKLILDTDYGDSYVFSRMGKELDESFKMLNDLIKSPVCKNTTGTGGIITNLWLIGHEEK